jgi:hypothetical protein
MKKLTFSVGDYVYLDGEKCYVYEATSEENYGVARCSDDMSWDYVEGKYLTKCHKNSRNQRICDENI